MFRRNKFEDKVLLRRCAPSNDIPLSHCKRSEAISFFQSGLYNVSRFVVKLRVPLGDPFRKDLREEQEMPPAFFYLVFHARRMPTLVRESFDISPLGLESAE